MAASGSEAVHKALTVALAQRKDASMILATRYGFHGKKGLAGAVTGCEADPERDPRVRFISFPQEECYSVQLRKKLLDLKPYRQELERLWRAHEGQICCLITEPYLGGGGSYHPQAAYLQMLQQFCREHGILFILDEVQSNFGRTGMMYAYSTYGIEPDMVVLGKGMGNGIPVDAVVGPRSLFEALSYGSGSDTWSGHPLGCAAVLATLEIFEQGHVLEHATKLSEVIEEGLLRLTELDGVEAIRGEGTVWGIQCEAAGDLTAAEVANRIVAVCYEGDSQGRAIHLLGPLAGTVLRVAPPLVMDLDEARDHLHAMHGLIQRCHWQH